MHDNKSLKRKTIAGLIWSASDLLVNQLFKLCILLVLARFLLPEEFGLIGLTTIFIAISISIMDSGMKNALIRDNKSNQVDYSTVFFFNLLIAIVLYITIYLSAPVIANFFEEPILIKILRVLMLVVIFDALSLIQKTLLIKEIDFKTQTKISLISVTISGITSILLAFLGAGVWSLVLQTLIAHIVSSLLLFYFKRWKPSLVFDYTSFKRLFSFGWKILVAGLINTLYQNAYYIVIGKFYSPSTLGYYTNAQKLRDVASQSITSAVQKVSFPVLSSIQDDDIKLKKGYRKIIKNSVYLTFPLMIGLSAIAESLIPLLLGSNWNSSIIYFQILCFAGMIFPLQAINLNILQVKGRSDLFLGLEIYKKSIGILIIFIVVIFNLGVIGLVWAAVIVSFISFFINSYYSSKLLKYSTLSQIRDILPSFIISVIMGSIVYQSMMLFTFNPILEVLVQSIIGIIIYIGLSIIIRIKELNTFKEIFKVVYSKITINSR